MVTSVQCLPERSSLPVPDAKFQEAKSDYLGLLIVTPIVTCKSVQQTSYHYLKKGSRNKSENYRPVSLTSVICKLLVRLIKDHMVDFLVRHKLLSSFQHGFLKARSCLTNMLCFFGRNH